MNRHRARGSLKWTAAVGLTVLTAVVSSAQDYESYVITIDAASPQPVGTGFIPATSGGEIIVLAEGNAQVIDPAERFDRAWFGPNGCTRLARVGQPIGNGMPYGALVGGFSNTITNYRFVGRMGAFHVLPNHVGQEFRLALNMSSGDQAGMSGQITATVIYVDDGYPGFAQIDITESTTLPVATGLVAAAGDRFVVLPYGILQTVAQPGPTEGHFGPEGLAKFNRSGQAYPEGPFGGLYGYFGDPAESFYVGDGGSWRNGPLVAGLELFLNLNLDPADLPGSDGRFVINVVRIPQ